MGTGTKVKRILGWLFVLGVLAGAVCLIRRAGSEWSEAIVQALAALGGLAYWAHRSRPRVTLRLMSNNGLYLELANVGNRIARRVTLQCDPPIPWSTTLATAPREEFGPVEDFGDMDRNQNYVFLVGGPKSHTVDVLDETTFTVSHERTWWFGRRRSTIRFGGSGGRSSLREGVATPIGEIAETVKKHGQTLDKIEKTMQTVGRRLVPPEDGGDELDLKTCSACGWERFTYYRSATTTTFLCANCREEYENEACECSTVYWCEHRPAPRQCVRQPS